MSFVGKPFSHDVFVSYSHGDAAGTGDSLLSQWSQSFIRELERELRFHVTERIEELQNAGMRAEDAARLARQQFGNYTAQVERTRDMDIAGGLDAALRNVRLSLRALAGKY